MRQIKRKNPAWQARFSARWAEILLIVLMVLGFGLRLVDLTDPPLDFHPTRQLRGAVVARSIYYQLSPSPDAFIQQQAINMRNSVADLEPPILESLAAGGYLLVGGEQLWVARVLSSLFWVLAAVPLFALARRFVHPAAALLAVAYYLFLPFGVVASRSFQPDPLMAALLVAAMYAAYRWSAERQGKWAWWAAAATGLAILVKAFAAYFALGFMAAAVLAAMPLRQALRDKQVWTMLAVCVLPAALYYLTKGEATSSGYVQNWIVALLPLALEPGFYVRWVLFLARLLGVAALGAALSGVLAAEGRARWLLLGAWAGYALYGITLPHQTTTHDYYHLFVVPLAAFSLAGLLDLLVRQMATQPGGWRAAFAGLMLAVTFFGAWIARSDMLGVSYHHEPPYWERVGAAVPRDGRTIGLVSAYGNLLSYYGWRTVSLWPTTPELNLAGLRGNQPAEFEAFFLDRTEGMSYFLVTAFNQLREQPELAEYLQAHYPVFSQGDGYIIYDLRLAAE